MTNSIKNVSNKINAELYNINDDVSLVFLHLNIFSWSYPLRLHNYSFFIHYLYCCYLIESDFTGSSLSSPDNLMKQVEASGVRGGLGWPRREIHWCPEGRDEGLLTAQQGC